MTAPIENQVIDPEYVLNQLTYEEKIALLSGNDMWHTCPVPRLGVPRVRMSDGPNGVRGISWLNSAPSACFPCATGTGASFDTGLVYRIGKAIGEEARERGTHCVLGPTTNIQRDPRGGRGFESFGEDPHHAGTMARAWIEGVQSTKVMTSPKHLVCNEQELNRRSTNSVVDERTLHEIYLEPFRIQCKASPQTFMASYNKLNGLHASEDRHILKDILRTDFKFAGMVMSDWGGTYSGGQAIEAGLDLEMPGPGMMRGANIEREVISGKLSPQAIDDSVLNVLKFVRQAQQSGIPFEAPEGTIDTPAVRSLLREAAADAIVLLKNEEHALPLAIQSGQTIAVIGPNAKATCISGGGSASLVATYQVSPYDAIARYAAEKGATVQYALGAQATRWTPLLNGIQSADGVKGSISVDFYPQNPFLGEKVTPAHSMKITGTYAMLHDSIPTSLPVRGYVRARFTFTPDHSGTWCFGLALAGQAELFVNDKLLISHMDNQQADVVFFNTGTEERTSELQVEAGVDYRFELRFSNFKQISAMSPYAGRRGAFRIGGYFKRDPMEEINTAVQLAKSADVTVLCVGLNGEWESESYDRDDIEMPGNINDLIRAVLEAQPNSIIVNQSGMPVAMPWSDQARTIVQAFYGGNDCGTGIADVLCGKVNPSAKLPFTWPREIENYPAHAGFGHPKDTFYSEGLGVGYRYFDRTGSPTSLFPFGHGLSYSKFQYSHLNTKWIKPFELQANFIVTNGGQLSGREAALVFVHPVSPQVTQPEIELAAFAKTENLLPGEQTVLTVMLDIKAFSYYCIDRKAWIADSGAYEIRVGSSSTALDLSRVVQLEQSWQWKGLHEPMPF